MFRQRHRLNVVQTTPNVVWTTTNLKSPSRSFASSSRHMEEAPIPTTPPSVPKATQVTVSPAAQFATSPEVRRVAGRISEAVPPLQSHELLRLVDRAADVWSFPEQSATGAFDPDSFTRRIDAQNDSLGIRPASGVINPATRGAPASQQPPRPAWDKMYFFKDPAKLSQPDESGFSVCTAEHRDAMRQRGYVQLNFINYPGAISVAGLPPQVGPPVAFRSRVVRAAQPWDDPSFVVVLPQRVPGFVSGAGTVAEQLVGYFDNCVTEEGVRYAPMRLWAKNVRRSTKAPTFDRSKFAKHCQAYCYLRARELPPSQVIDGVGQLIKASEAIRAEKPEGLEFYDWAVQLYSNQ